MLVLESRPAWAPVVTPDLHVRVHGSGGQLGPRSRFASSAGLDLFLPAAEVFAPTSEASLGRRNISLAASNLAPADSPALLRPAPQTPTGDRRSDRRTRWSAPDRSVSRRHGPSRSRPSRSTSSRSTTWPPSPVPEPSGTSRPGRGRRAACGRSWPGRHGSRSVTGSPVYMYTSRNLLQVRVGLTGCDARLAMRLSGSSVREWSLVSSS